MKRKYGIDCVRIISMLFIIIGHLVGRGGIKNSCTVGDANYYVVSFLQVLTLFAINTFGIISGYFGIDRKVSIAKSIEIWLQMVFWSAVISTIYIFAFNYQISKEILLNMFLPIVSKAYWYMTAYFVVLIVSPLANRIMNIVNLKILVAFDLIIVFLLCVVITNSGNNPVWLLILYFIGGTIKRIEKEEKGFHTKKKYSLMGFMLCIVLTWTVVIVQENAVVVWNRWVWVFFCGKMNTMCPSSVTMLFAGIFLFLWGRVLNLSQKISNICRKITPLVLSVYLIHVHPLIFNSLRDRLSFMSQWNPILLLFSIMVITFFVFVLCILLDTIRYHIFTYFKNCYHQYRSIHGNK